MLKKEEIKTLYRIIDSVVKYMPRARFEDYSLKIEEELEKKGKAVILDNITVKKLWVMIEDCGGFIENSRK